jgi:hypothetical protein
MRPFILILPIWSTAACQTTTEYVYVTPDIPAETLTPCPISDRVVRTTNELAALATEHLRSAECANGKIETMAEILGPS